MDSDMDLDNLLQFCKETALKAGQLVLAGAEQLHVVSEKTHSADLVTEWDVKVENLIRQAVATNYPDYAFVGEESYAPQVGLRLDNLPTFVVDPIDGTGNFVHGFPFVCVSIGFIWKGEPTVGVIYNPFLDQLFYSLKGSGSYLTQNNLTRRLPLLPSRPLPSLSSALVGVSWGSTRSTVLSRIKAPSFARLAADPKETEGGAMCRSIRSVGSCCQSIVMVASGQLDFFWDIGCWPWDVCAGFVIAQEAGCLVSGGKSDPHDGIVTGSILAGRKYIIVRSLIPSEGNSMEGQQKELIEEVYNTVNDWDL